MRKLCLEPGCPDPPVYRSRCRRHARQRNRVLDQGRAGRSIYNTRRWKLLRRRVLNEQPLCDCGAVATCVDHIVAIRDGGAVWERANLQALCASDHAAKTRREQQRWG